MRIDWGFVARLDARPVCDRFLDGGYTTAVAGCEVAIDFQCPGLNVPRHEHIVTKAVVNGVGLPLRC